MDDLSLPKAWRTTNFAALATITKLKVLRMGHIQAEVRLQLRPLELRDNFRLKGSSRPCTNRDLSVALLKTPRRS